MRKVLVTIWIVFSLGWSAMLIWVYLLGAGLSSADANESISFILYWLLPILVPALVYRAVGRYRSNKRAGDDINTAD